MTMPTPEFLQNVFKNVDKDKSGFISTTELQMALSNGSWKPFNAETVRLMISMFDKTNSGQIAFEDFGALWKYVIEWQSCFKSFDKDNSGSIDQLELQTALGTFGYRLTDDTVKILMKRFDHNGNGKILFDDFIHCCVMLNLLTASFSQHDQDKDGVVTLQYEQFLSMVFGLKL